MAKKQWLQTTGDRYHLFKVTLSNSKGSVRGNPYRVLGMNPENTLYQLAEQIIRSFDFDFDHPFGFYNDIKSWTRATKGYELFADMGEGGRFPGVKKADISNVFTTPGEKWLFFFDYGDEWHFVVEYQGEQSHQGTEKLPVVLKIVGDSPIQYSEEDEYEDDDYDEEDDNDDDDFVEDGLISPNEEQPTVGAVLSEDGKFKGSMILADNALQFVNLESALEAISFYVLNPPLFESIRSLIVEYLKGGVRRIAAENTVSYIAAFTQLVLEKNNLINGKDKADLAVFYQIFGTTKSAVAKRTREILPYLGNLDRWADSKLTLKKTNLIQMPIGDHKLVSRFRIMVEQRYDAEMDGLLFQAERFGGSVGTFKKLMKAIEEVDDEMPDYYDMLSDDIWDDDDHKHEDDLPWDDEEMPSEKSLENMVQHLGAQLKSMEKAHKKLFKASEKSPEFDFWYSEGRDYLEMTFGMMLLHRALGDLGKSLEQGLRLLTLSPSDGIGARYYVLPLAIAVKDFKLAGGMLEHSEENSALWLFSAGLYYYAVGETDKAKEVLKEAIVQNNHVAQYLNGSKRLPNKGPEAYSPGSTEEAHFYCGCAMPVWNMIPGAVAFLNQVKKKGHLRSVK